MISKEKTGYVDKIDGNNTFGGTTMITLELERSDEFDLLSKHNVINRDNEVRRCLIPVIYFDDSPGMVKPEELIGLIQKRMIISFRRAIGWVRISGDPVRGKGGKYEGLDRRNR